MVNRTVELLRLTADQNFWHVRNPTDCPKARLLIVQAVNQTIWRPLTMHVKRKLIRQKFVPIFIIGHGEQSRAKIELNLFSVCLAVDCYDNKLHIFGFGVIGRIKQATYICCLGFRKFFGRFFTLFWYFIEQRWIYWKKKSYNLCFITNLSIYIIHCYASLKLNLNVCLVLCVNCKGATHLLKCLNVFLKPQCISTPIHTLEKCTSP